MVKTIIAEGLHIFGDLSGSADIEIAGSVDGNISAATVDILTTGQVEGSIAVTHAHVRGRMSGSLSATSVEIHTGAVCEADITAEDLEARNGATVIGRLTITGTS